jgi:hypothetical protein
MSGTLVAMIYYGLQLLSPNFFYMNVRRQRSPDRLS